MSTTLSGWAGIFKVVNGKRVSDYASPLLISITVPGTKKKVLLRKEVAPVFAAALADINRLVIPLDPGPLDGYEYRDARTGAGLSNHAGGVAADFRYDILKADHQRHMSSRQIAAMHTILDRYKTSKGKRIFGWGGDWKVGQFCDEMHLEAGQSWEPGVGSFVSAADFLDVQKRLRIRPDGTIAKPTVAKPAAPQHVLPRFPGVFHVGAHGPYVTAIQKGLVAAGYRLVLDGKFGPQTKAALVAWQRKHLRRATGVVDAATYKVLAR